jgi:hypothetical protein
VIKKKIVGQDCNSVVPRDGEKEVLLDVFFLQAPDLLATFVDNGVLVGVIGNGSGAR